MLNRIFHGIPLKRTSLHENRLAYWKNGDKDGFSRGIGYSCRSYRCTKTVARSRPKTVMTNNHSGLVTDRNRRGPKKQRKEKINTENRKHMIHDGVHASRASSEAIEASVNTLARPITYTSGGANNIVNPKFLYCNVYVLYKL